MLERHDLIIIVNINDQI